MEGKNILVGVTGGIASYKIIEVVSHLKKAGANIRVIMTQAATEFVTALTFREISDNPVAVNMWDEPKTWNIEHIRLAQWADLLIVAPATANIIGKIANGIADDMLTTIIMATKAKVMIFPAMNTNMYLNSIVQKNMKNLEDAGYQVIMPDCGLMACGTEGEGRLPEPSAIVHKISEFFSSGGSMQGKKIIITAGGTREAIDPVRYVGNRSSGKMGYALAKAAAERGAAVILISGATNLSKPNNVFIKSVETALEMKAAILAEYEDADIVIKAAAVADYRPAEYVPQKIKKTEVTLTIELLKNPDILKELGQKKKKQILIGFAAETQNLINNAQKKLVEKNLDMIVANDVTAEGAGFNTHTNIVKLISRNGGIEELAIMAKEELAEIILDKIDELMLERSVNNL